METYNKKISRSKYIYYNFSEFYETLIFKCKLAGLFNEQDEAISIKLFRNLFDK